MAIHRLFATCFVKGRKNVTMKLLEKRLWPNLLYILLFFIFLLTLWQMTVNPASVSYYTLYSSNASFYTYPVKSLPAHDYEQLINIHNFNFSILNPVCNESAPLLLILVHSSPANQERRNVIRQTWGTYPGTRIVFAVGLSRSAPEHQAAMMAVENEKYADLVQGSFLDAYRNMTYKHVMVMKYAIYHCAQAKYILKTDDDVFVNMPQLVNFLNNDLSPYGGEKMLFCTVEWRGKVQRSYRSKWRVSFKEYPNRNYPNYCLGWAVLYSSDVLFELYRETQMAKYFWIDDVHITGTMAHKIGLNHTDIQHLVLPDIDDHYVNNHLATTTPFLLGASNREPQQIRTLWRFVTERAVIRDYLLD